MGSSPLTRGKHFIIQDVPKCGRLIPAHAGKTTRTRYPACREPAHPRSRGENHDLPVDELHFTGSSPLTRGKLHEAVNLGAIRRLIPAHAGKTPDQCSHAARQPAHPRSRGENPRMNLSPGLATGSSPLTRGKPIARTYSGSCAGLIPAHAGKTSAAILVAISCRAHPRSRGENVCVSLSPWPPRGSSPLTRGKPLHGHERQPGQRLIPANAGKTTSGHLGSTRARAHPR